MLWQNKTSRRRTKRGQRTTRRRPLFEHLESRVVFSSGMAGGEVPAGAVCVPASDRNAVAFAEAEAAPIQADVDMQDLLVAASQPSTQSSPSPNHNPTLPADVNADGAITPLDELLLLNKFHWEAGSPGLDGDAEPPPSGATGAIYWDVSDDGYFTPLDLLQVINQLNAQSSPPGEGEVPAPTPGPQMPPDDPVVILPWQPVSGRHLAQQEGYGLVTGTQPVPATSAPVTARSQLLDILAADVAGAHRSVAESQPEDDFFHALGELSGT